MYQEIEGKMIEMNVTTAVSATDKLFQWNHTEARGMDKLQREFKQFWNCTTKYNVQPKYK